MLSMVSLPVAIISLLLQLIHNVYKMNDWSFVKFCCVSLLPGFGVSFGDFSPYFCRING